jgi:uncharacterized membrane protein YvlD (DUF360 family)
MIFEKGASTFLLAGLGFMAASLVAKPVINILLLPINLVTFGFFRWVSSAIVLYLVVLVIPGFRLENFHFAGYSSKWIDIPNMHFEGILAYVAFAFIISLITSVIFWIIK